MLYFLKKDLRHSKIETDFCVALSAKRFRNNQIASHFR